MLLEEVVAARRALAAVEHSATPELLRGGGRALARRRAASRFRRLAILIESHPVVAELSGTLRGIGDEMEREESEIRVAEALMQLERVLHGLTSKR